MFFFFFPDTVNRDTSILLANALFFKGIWEKSFSEQGTENKCFYLLSGKCQNTPMMDTVDYFKFDDNKMIDAKIVELPYAVINYLKINILDINVFVHREENSQWW